MKRMAINGMIAVAGLALGVGLSLRPWRTLRYQHEQTRKASLELRRSEAAREDALRREARYNDPIGREELARAQGWSKPGESPADR